MKKLAKCIRCGGMFALKDIYTIQQFQYRKEPPYKWCVDYFAKQNIGEWDSFCEACIIHYQKISLDEYKKSK
jgi:hypothetical protein